MHVRIAALILLCTLPAAAQINARMLREPDVSETQIAFVYAGDIWVVAKEGGTAQRLSSPQGEERYPKFSPDGGLIAYAGAYDGNTDIYTVAVTGGVPARLTHHPDDERVVEWHPSGEKVLFATGMTSGKDRFHQLYTVSKDGGLPEKLPMAYGEFASYSPDGEKLAYMPWDREFRTWKRYRGGMAPDVWLFHLGDNSSVNLTEHGANDSLPMWHEDIIYFVSDRGANERANIWAFDVVNQRTHQVTFFDEFDVRFPSIGPKDIVFENGGQLYLLDLATEERRAVDIHVVTDRSTLKPYTKNVGGFIQSADISPTGKRAVFEARGDIFTVPKEHGVVRNLTRSSGVAERYPAWSPDGQSIVYFSDRDGEYALMKRGALGKEEEELLLELGPGYRYAPQWSPDGEKVVFIDQTMKIQLFDLEIEELTEIDQALWKYHGELSAFEVSWSSDSRWFAYSRGLENRNEALFLYDTEAGALRQVTSGFYSDMSPRFDPEGKYLYFLTNRNFSPEYSDFDNSWIYPNATQIALTTLRKDIESPLAPRNDDEAVEDQKEDEDDKDEEEKDEGEDEEHEDDEEEEDGEENGENDDEGEENSEEPETNEEENDPADEEEEGDDTEKQEKETLEIDLDGLEQRIIMLPPKAGNFGGLAAVKGKVLFLRRPRTGAGGGNSPVVYYDLEEREEKTVIGDVDGGFTLSHDDKKLLVRKSGGFYIIDVKPGQKLDKRLATNDFQTTIDPKKEWRQLFTEAWRLQRDFFYDPGMHGVYWEAVRDQYAALIEECVTRWDVNYVLGEMIGELNAGHTYRRGGDTESAPSRPVGLLGADFALEDGAYRIASIVRGALWDVDVRSPLDQPGVDLSEGDYLLAVNGLPIDTSRDPWAAFEGLAGDTVQLTVNSEPTLEGARDVFVQTLRSEYRLRNLAWIEAMRKKVDEATDGRVGYIYVPDTGRGGQSELVRMFYGQHHKEGLIIDERFNSGGQIPDRFVELLNRPLYNYWGVRDGKDWQWPPVTHVGPKVMLINSWSGSGGDAFPYYFRESGTGPLIGTRTWGGLIGMTGAPSLIDGGSVTVPTFGIYSKDGEWIIESYGVDPDIEVKEDPSALARGEDPQLERAIAEVLAMLEKNPVKHPEKPEYPDRARPGQLMKSAGN